jgi:hypothetical protein
MPSDQNGPPPRVEVITAVQRRRRWPTAEKVRLVEETMQPGMSVSYVARRPPVCCSTGDVLRAHRTASAAGNLAHRTRSSSLADIFLRNNKRQPAVRIHEAYARIFAVKVVGDEDAQR